MKERSQRPWELSQLEVEAPVLFRRFSSVESLDSLSDPCRRGVDIYSQAHPPPFSPPKNPLSPWQADGDRGGLHADPEAGTASGPAGPQAGAAHPDQVPDGDARHRHPVRRPRVRP